MIQHTILRGDTLLVKDGETYIVYSPFQGRITRVSGFPAPNSELADRLKEEGFFAEVPTRTMPDNDAEWGGFHSLTLLLTRGCNLGCGYCYAKALPGGASMPLDLALGSLEWFAGQLRDSIIRVTFHGGGEPTLEESIIQAVFERTEQLRQGKKTRYQIVTNGTAPREFMEWMMARHFGISISMDGPPAIQNRNRPMADGSPSSKVVERTIHYLVSQNYPFTIRVTYSPVDDVEAIVDYFASLGVKSLHLEPLFPFGRNYSEVAFGKESGQEVYSPIAAELVKNFLRAVDLCGIKGIRIYNGHLIHFVKGIGYFCGAASGRSMMVGHDGLLTGCLEVVDFKDKDAKTFELGAWDSRTRTFNVSKEKLQVFHARHADALPECKTCYARYHCAGGCAVKAVRATGDFFERDIPYCGFTRALVPVLVKRIAKTSGI